MDTAKYDNAISRELILWWIELHRDKLISDYDLILSCNLLPPAQKPAPQQP